MVRIVLIDKKADDRISSIIEFTKKLEVYNEKNIPLNFERNLQSILSIFLNKLPSKLVYILYNVGVSSSWELFNHFGASSYQKDINKILNWLETKNAVEEIYEDTEENKIIRKTWEKIHPNGKRSYRKTQLFKLTAEF